ncbi:MAG: hypothetical protein R6U67_09765 [Sodalinema sp.]|uniref:hypothetical protein n=1 Tax=Sodalinema sp. TaxID=3080550 RepID=UPI00122B414C|nr:MAG: hypothetical protein EYR95_02400 [Phormidium sp. SL48-SHIP]
MNVHLSPLRYLAVVSVCLLIAIFSVLPQSWSLSNHWSVVRRVPVSGWVISTPVGHPPLLTFSIPTATEESLLTQPMKTLRDASDGDQLISEFGQILTRLRRIFWAIARRCRLAVQSTQALLVTETNLAHKGDDMLENAA